MDSNRRILSAGKRFFSRNPLFFLFLSFWLGLAMSAFFELRGFFAWGLLFGFAGLFVLSMFRAVSRTFLWGAFLLFVCFSGVVSLRPPTFSTQYPVLVVGKVNRLTDSSIRLTQTRVLQDAQWHSSDFPVYLSRAVCPSAPSGSWVALEGNLLPLPGAFFLQASPFRNAFSVRYHSSWFASLLEKGAEYSTSFSVFSRTILGEETAGLASQMLFGKGGSSQMREALNDSGIGHLFVVSGLHFFLVFQISWTLLGFFFPRSLLRIPIVLVALTFFFLLCGFSPSAFRGFVMLGIFLLFRSLQRKSSRWNAWGLAGLLLLMGDGAYAFDAGFQLSMSASAGLLLFASFPSPQRWTWIRPLLPAFGALFFTLPVVLLHFGRIPGLSLLVNVFLVNIAGFFLMTGLVVSLFLFLCGFSWLSGVFLQGLSPFLRGMEELVRFLSRGPGTLALDSPLAVLILVGEIAGCFLLLGFCFWKKRVCVRE
ncbi:MAG TPA: ComEC/Rec2 family competence protein [Thermotogota bacterium]|nr:ComEC/Rec2 family competence protein [Thermotogota bacterium]HRW91849.1 ComEC/Rec2 family competence protein [Thermotogota bacterium]